MNRSDRQQPPAPDVVAVLNHLRRIVGALRRSSRVSEREVGLTGAQLFVLQALASEGVLSINDVAARAGTHQSTVSGVVKRLVERGLVRRAPSASDGRRLDLRLTTAARALLKRAPRAAPDRLIAGIESLPARHRASLYNGLHRLVLAMDLGNVEPRMFFEDDDATGR